MEKYLIGYALLVSLIGFWSMGEDKKRAVKKRYRISEKTLFIIALLGGSVGSILGMYYFRHKTKHWHFRFGMPSIIILQAAIIGLILNPHLIF